MGRQVRGAFVLGEGRDQHSASKAYMARGAERAPSGSQEPGYLEGGVYKVLW